MTGGEVAGLNEQTPLIAPSLSCLVHELLRKGQKKFFRAAEATALGSSGEYPNNSKMLPAIYRAPFPFQIGESPVAEERGPALDYRLPHGWTSPKIVPA
jgi:hypothetical protein